MRFSKISAVTVATVAMVQAVLPARALAAVYDVTVRGGNQLAAITFATKEPFAKPCWLEPASLTLTLPGEGPGKIEMTTRVDASKPCLEAEGPQRGVIALPNEDGARLPGIPYGRYEVKIDGESYGTLVATRHEVALVNE